MHLRIAASILIGTIFHCKCIFGIHRQLFGPRYEELRIPIVTSAIVSSIYHIGTASTTCTLTHFCDVSRYDARAYFLDMEA